MAKRIKECRQKNNLTQEELANKLGLKKSAIAKYENGRVENIKRNIIEEMAKIFDVKPSYLMGWDSNITIDIRNKEDTYKTLLAYYNALSNYNKTRADNYIKNLFSIQQSDEEVLNAAHQRTDIDIPKDVDTSDDDIMDDDKF
jgi:transcriptional regulator with XRE-family HTH domain